jgi:hypothetical protein
MVKLLFICKKRPSHYGASYGLYNSCRFLVNALKHIGIEAKFVEVIDNNYINAEVASYKPTHVFIEALWVVPSKFNVLIPLYPKIQWYVRLHSNTPFLANEGMAIEWIKEYSELHKVYPQFHIASNSRRMIEDLKQALGIKCLYAPNIYCPDPEDKPAPTSHPESNIFKAGCFGAIRPLKNHLIQAKAAMAFANELGKTLEFHINHTPVETQGESVYRNLLALFKGSKHKLIEHDWYFHPEFLKLVQSMDMGLQVSLSETFNIVAADFAYLNVPVIGSPEIEWMNSMYQAKPTNLDNILAHMWLAWIGRKINLQRVNEWGLRGYNESSLEAWEKLIFSHKH